jgi:hypothetical protein
MSPVQNTTEQAEIPSSAEVITPTSPQLSSEMEPSECKVDATANEPTAATEPAPVHDDPIHHERLMQGVPACVKEDLDRAAALEGNYNYIDTLTSSSEDSEGYSPRLKRTRYDF